MRPSGEHKDSEKATKPVGSDGSDNAAAAKWSWKTSAKSRRRVPQRHLRQRTPRKTLGQPLGPPLGTAAGRSGTPMIGAGGRHGAAIVGRGRIAEALHLPPTLGATRRRSRRWLKEWSNEHGCVAQGAPETRQLSRRCFGGASGLLGPMSQAPWTLYATRMPHASAVACRLIRGCLGLSSKPQGYPGCCTHDAPHSAFRMLPHRVGPWTDRCGLMPWMQEQTLNLASARIVRMHHVHMHVCFGFTW